MNQIYEIGYIEWKVEYTSLKFRRVVWTRDVNLEIIRVKTTFVKINLNMWRIDVEQATIKPQKHDGDQERFFRKSKL